MTLSGTFTFRGPRAVVFELLQDPEVLIKVMPGAERLERVAENRYEGVMKVGLGPLTAARVAVEVHRAVGERGDRRQEPHHGARVADIDAGRAVQARGNDPPGLTGPGAGGAVGRLLDAHTQSAQPLGHQQGVAAA